MTKKFFWLFTSRHSLHFISSISFLAKLSTPRIGLVWTRFVCIAFGTLFVFFSEFEGTESEFWIQIRTCWSIHAANLLGITTTHGRLVLITKKLLQRRFFLDFYDKHWSFFWLPAAKLTASHRRGHSTSKFKSCFRWERIWSLQGFIAQN